jgi:hypothetical protein
MTDPSGYGKTLALPAGFDAPRLLRYDDVTAHAITRDEMSGYAVSGCRAKNATSASAVPRGFCTCRRCVASGSSKGSAFGSQAARIRAPRTPRRRPAKRGEHEGGEDEREDVRASGHRLSFL